MKQYEVLKFIADGRRQHIAVDCVEGVLLAEWVERNPNPQELWKQFRKLAEQLEAYHGCQLTSAYQYLSPYSVVIDSTDPAKWCLLDPRSKTNERLLSRIRRPDVRAVFLPPGQQAYQHMTEQSDLYGFGRVVQFVLSALDPPLRRWESRLFRKMIAESLQAVEFPEKAEVKGWILCPEGRRLRNFRQMVRRLSKAEKRAGKLCDGKKGNHKKRILLAAGAVLVCVGLGEVGRFQLECFLAAEEKKEPVCSNGEAENEEQEITAEQEADMCYLEMGMACLAELGDFEKSRKYLDKIKDSVLYNSVSGLLADLDGTEVLTEEEFVELAGIVERELWEKEENSLLYTEGMMELYLRKEGEQCRRQAIRLGEGWLAQAEGEGQEKRIRERLLHAYGTEERENQIAQLEWLFLHAENGAEAEQKCMELVQYYTEQQKWMQAEQLCEKGIYAYPERNRFRIMQIRLFCQNPERTEAECAECIRQHLKEQPDLEEVELYQETAEEFGIRREGDSICVER